MNGWPPLEDIELKWPPPPPPRGAAIASDALNTTAAKLLIQNIRFELIIFSASNIRTPAISESFDLPWRGINETDGSTPFSPCEIRRSNQPRLNALVSDYARPIRARSRGLIVPSTTKLCVSSYALIAAR